jgi:hypothetical protein
VANDLVRLLLGDVEVASASFLGGAEDSIGGGLVGDPDHCRQLAGVGKPRLVTAPRVLDELDRVAINSR